MTLRSLLAKDWTVEINTGTTATPTWTPVRGLTEFAEEIDTETEDDSDFDGDGWASQVVTQRGWTLTLNGNRKRDADAVAFVPDPGQEFLRKAGHVVGPGANVHCRWYRRDGSPDAYEGRAAVDYKGAGGETTDLEPFEVELLGQGKPLEIENPVAA
ncbi:hypothetical protein [Nonomuraea sp. B19D2]|uniref:phage tail tube protein n=1 Tax=Nonomuraea sp. B19D2 TaxID=3159561 RepID=UPI0032DA0189